MSTNNDTQCRIVKIGGMPDPETVGVYREAQDAAEAYQNRWQTKPKDGTRYVILVKNTLGQWPDEPLMLNEDDDTETIVRLIAEAAQSSY